VTTYWVSFLDQDRPVGKKATGVVIVEAETPEDAMSAIAQKNLHPGGDPTIDDITHRAPSAEWYDRILTSKDARDVTRLMCIASQDRYEDDDED